MRSARLLGLGLVLGLLSAVLVWSGPPAGAACATKPATARPLAGSTAKIDPDCDDRPAASGGGSGGSGSGGYTGPVYDTPGHKVVTLGDSFASGTGTWNRPDEYDQQDDGGASAWGYEITSRAGADCWREDDETPGPVLAAQIGAESIFLACAGAAFAHVHDQLELLTVQWPTDAAAGWPDATFVVIAGGNDVRSADGLPWEDIISSCVLDRKCNQEPGNQVANWDDIRGDAEDFYLTLADAAPGARIRVLGYPRLMTPSPWCRHVPGIQRMEAEWIDTMVIDLNSALGDAMAQVRALRPSVDIEFVDVVDGFERGACPDWGPRHVNGVQVYGALQISSASFHPSRLGHEQYGAEFQGSL